MKFIRLTLYFAFAAILLVSCKKEADSPLQLQFDDSNTAKLKVVYTSAYFIRDSIQIKINDARASNTFLSSLATTFLPTPYPGGGLNTGGSGSPWYLSVPPGNTKIFISVPKKVTSVDSIIRYSGNIVLEAGKYYSAYITDTLLNTATVLVTDNHDLPAIGTSRYKFINLIPNLAGVDLYYKNNLVMANIAYKGVSPEFTLITGTSGVWAIRAAGAAPTSTPLAIYPSGSLTNTIPSRRVLTVFAKGYSGGSASRIPVVSLLYNK